jgi:hypothetical protein
LPKKVVLTLSVDPEQVGKEVFMVSADISLPTFKSEEDKTEFTELIARLGPIIARTLKPEEKPSKCNNCGLRWFCVPQRGRACDDASVKQN